MKPEAPLLTDQFVTLEPADSSNVDLLVDWTLNPIAQGPYKHVPYMTAEHLRTLFLGATDRQYFLIKRTADDNRLGRFYWRAWHFDSPNKIDWELNIFLAAPMERGKGYGTAVQRLASDYLVTCDETASVFAFTLSTNVGERRALEKAGFHEVGELPHAYYRVDRPEQPCVLLTRVKSA